jgi:putative DNA primase/helicase
MIVPNDNPWLQARAKAEAEREKAAVNMQPLRLRSLKKDTELISVSTVAAASIDFDLNAPEFSDEWLALTFAERHKEHIRYVDPWGKWMLWNGAVWQKDDKRTAFSMVREICRDASCKATSPHVKERLASAATVAAVERLAKADQRLAATIDQWDADPWALNTPGGIINLRSGELQSHSPAAYCTKITSVAPDGDCPMWRAFLHRVTAGNRELQMFLQRIAGYALTGDVSEHALFFAYGTGGNGKSVFINTVAAIMGGYHATAVMDTFTATQHDRHKTELAMLRGARLVTAQETEQGRRWAESRIKSLTGGDPITANYMRQDHFTFSPQFKLLIAGNHKPGLRNVDDAMRRRMHLLPFTQTIGPSERDLQLPDRLKAEWPGIMLWAVDGCAEWREKRLSPPEVVTQATAEYLNAEDTVALWLTECCKKDVSLKSSVSELFNSWSKWAAEAGEYPGSQKSFSQSMINRGFAASRLHGGRAALIGIGLNVSDDNWRTVDNG